MGRAVCKVCLRPQSVCLCQWLPQPNERIVNSISLLILQTPDEAKHPLNTGRLLQLGLQNCEIVVGRTFNQCQKLSQQLARFTNPWLVFPADDAITVANQGSEQHLPEQPDALILLDATWRKAKAMYLGSADLQQLPCLKLDPQQQSRYRIRSSKIKNGLSTLEAACSLLQLLGQPQADYQPLYQAMDKMIDMQIDAMGSQTYRENYLEQ